MSADETDRAAGLFSYEFVVLTLAAAFGFCNIAVFYGLASYLERAGFDPAWRGALIAAEPLAALLTRPLLGVLLTPRHALAAARLALVALGLILPCYQLAHTVAALLLVRVVHGLAFVVLVSAVMVLLTKTVPAAMAGRAFGYFSLSSLVPYALMPPLTEWLLPRVGGEVQAYGWTALLTLPALALMVPLGPRLGARAFAPEERRPPSLGDIRQNLGGRSVRVLLAANLLLFTATTQVFFFVKPHALSLGLADPGLFFTLSTVASITVRVVAGRFYDRLPRRSLTVVALLALAVCLGLLTLAQRPAPFYGLAGAYGLCLGVALPLINACMFLESAPRLRGLNMNLMLFTMDAGYVAGPVMGGTFMAGAGGFVAVLVASAVCVAGAAVLLLPLTPKDWPSRPASD